MQKFSTLASSRSKNKMTMGLRRILAITLAAALFLALPASGATHANGLSALAGVPSAAANQASPLVANTITITKGGTYHGDWVSTDPTKAAVTISTDEAVIVENSTVTSMGQLIAITGTNGANVIIRNVTGTALDPQVAGKARGAFIIAYVINSLVVQNCTMVGTSFGVKMAFSTPTSFKVLDNYAINLEDRASDGSGGLTTTRPQFGHFLYLYQMSLPSGAEVAWNRVVQTINQSSTDNVIDVFKSQGTAAAPISIHDNYVEGASSPAAANYGASAYSTTGDTTTQEVAFVNFTSNQVVHTAGNGIGISNGHDISATNNRVVSCGRDSAGVWYSRASLLAISLTNKSGGPTFFNNVITGTAGGLIVPGSRSVPVASDSYASPEVLVDSTNNINGNLFTDPCLVNGVLTLDAEDAERAFWTNKVATNNQTIGDQHGAVAVVVSPATSSLLLAQTQQFSAAVTWASNTAVTWTLSPAIGTISAGGLYTAPTSGNTSQTVTVTATSVQDPTKSASATAVVGAINVLLTPASTSLAASQTQQYSATVYSSTNQGVTWSISPSVGSISTGGLYTAPASITATQTVTVTASSVVDATKSTTASITLQPPVKVNLVASYIKLTGSQTAQLTAVVANSANTDVTWTLSPAVGVISAAGLYTAPANITAQQTITFTATSVADPTKSAAGSIVLNPPVSVAVVPAVVTLSPSGTQQFAGNVSWASSAAVTWTMSPALGTLSSTGLYTAPAGTTSPQTVIITATSAADPTKSNSATVTLNPPVNVSVTPASATITLGQTQPYVATVLYSANTNVTWSISPALGTISGSGRYTPPTTAVTTPQTVTITATSVADTTRTANASVTVNPPVAVTLVQTASSLNASQTSQLTATVAWNSNQAVTYSISPAVGTISASGLYTAPASITSAQTVSITAVSVADNTKYAVINVSLLPPIKVNLVASYVKLTNSQTAQLTAVVANTSNNGVVWTLSPVVGSISSAGLYTAPASITAQQTITFTATSVADSTKSASGSIVLNPPVSVSVVPAAVALGPSGTQQFAGNVAWASSAAVTWTMSPAIGTLSSTGLYTAPVGTASPQLVTVTATSVADPTKSNTATVTLNPSVKVSITPANATVTIGQTQPYTATVLYNSNTNVTWSISPAVGTISASGRYTPPTTAVTTPQTVTVIATSVADTTQFASASVTVNPPVAVSLAQTATSVNASQTSQFTATVAWNSNQNVTWSISPAVGAISTSGLYTAPASITSQQTVSVTAVSVADGSKYAVANVILLPPIKVNLVAANAALTANQTAQFTALVLNTSNTAVTWAISPAVGNISPTGLYTAPGSITAQQTITFTATSVADSTKSVSGSIVLSPSVSVIVVPAAVTLSPSASQQFVANVAWSSNAAVTWTMSPSAGTLSAAGLYTAPLVTGSPQLVTVTATSVADPTKSNTSTVTLNPSVNVSVAPASATVTIGQTQPYLATVLYSSNSNVNWSISPALGSISASGRYTPPATAVSTPQTVTIIATSVTDASQFATASVTVNPPVAVSLAQSATNLNASQTSQLTATIAWNSNQGVTWSLSPAVGTISADGLYTAPSSITSQQTVSITAISVADGSKYAVANVVLLPPIKVNLVSNSAAITANQTAQFTALVLNTSNTAVTWAINPVIGNISSSGLYTAPSSILAQQTITFTATSVADPTKSASGGIVLNPPVGVAVVPNNVTLTTSHTQQFVANVAWSNNAAVTWSMTPSIGTLTSTGLYTAPDTINANATVSVTATSVADPSMSNTATVNLLTLIGPAPIVITEGGTYSGNWVSNDPNVAAVSIVTDAPVIIQNSTVQSRGTLISIVGNSGANVTIRNVTGTGLDPLVAGLQRGSFVAAFATRSLVVQNCTINGTAFGVKVFSAQLNALSILNNVATNLEDRASDGNGGFQSKRPQLGHFIIMHQTYAPNGAEIGWNQVKQTMGQSSTEDVINIFSSYGTSSNPIWVHDNYMEGNSSPVPLAYTGNALMTDGDSTGLTGYVLFQANEVVHTAGGGVAIAVGHDNSAIGNRVVSCGKDTSGNWFTRLGVSAIYVGNYYGASNFENNSITSTWGGLISPDTNGLPLANDGPSETNGTNSTIGNTFTDPCIVNGVLNLAAEDTERAYWANKLTSNTIVIGDQH